MKMKEKKGGRKPCCDKDGVKKGAWTHEEDKILVDYINKNGHGTWQSLPKLAGLLRCGKSCRLRWKNYLHPDIKRGAFTTEEEQLIIKLHAILGNKWAAIASKLPGRTDNEIKNLWHTHLKKRFPSTDLNMVTSAGPSMNQSTAISQLPPKSTDTNSLSPSTIHMADWESIRMQAETRLSMDSLLLNPSVNVKTECSYYLQLWDSEVGDSFRNIKKEDGLESGSGITMQAGPALTFTSADAYDEQSSKKDYSDHSNSFQMEGSSDSALNLLLDFPSGGGYYMDFLKQETEDFCSFPFRQE